MKCHSPADKALLLCVLFLLVLISVMQARTCSALGRAIRVESRPMLSVRVPEPAGSKKPDTTAEHYFCKEQPLLHWASSSTTGQYAFTSEFQLMESNEGPQLAELKNAGERRRVNIYSGEAEVEVGLLESGSYLHCKLVESCTEEMIDSVIDGAAACLFIVRNKDGRRMNLIKPTVVRLLPPEEKKAAGGRPVTVSSGGVLGGAPPGGPGGGGSPGMLEFFSFTSSNDWFAQEIERMIPPASIYSFMGAIPTEAQWQKIRTGRWYEAEGLESNCHVGGVVASTSEQLSACHLFYQIAAAAALLAQMNPGFFTYMDQPPKSETQTLGGSGSSTGGNAGKKDADQNAQQQGADSPTDKKGQQSPPPPPGGATPQANGQLSVNDILTAAYQFVVDGLRSGEGMSRQLMAMVNGNPAIRALLLTLGTIEQEVTGSAALRSEHLIDLFEAEGGSTPSQLHRLVATWLLHQLGLQNQPASPWQWVLQQINLTRAIELTDTVERQFLDELKKWFDLQISGNQDAAQAAVQQSDYSDLEAFTGSWNFASGVDQVYAVTSQLENTAIEETGSVWVNPSARSLPETPVRPEETPAERVARLEGPLMTLQSRLFSNPAHRSIMAILIGQVAGQVVASGDQQQLLARLMEYLRRQPEQLAQWLPRLLMNAGLQANVAQFCADPGSGCQQLVEAHMFEALPEGLPSLTGGIGEEGALNASLRVAITERARQDRLIARSIASVEVLAWMRYHGILSTEQLSVTAQGRDAVVLIDNVANAGERVFVRWLHLLARLTNLVQVGDGLVSLFKELLRDADLGRNIALIRNLEVIRYWPSELPEPINMMEYCRRLDPARAGFLSQQGVLHVLLNDGVINHTSMLACQAQSPNCVSEVLGDLQSVQPQRVMDVLQRYAGARDTDFTAFVSGLKRLVELARNPRGRPMAAVLPLSSQPRPAPVRVSPPSTAAGNRLAGWLRSQNIHQNPQLQNLAELTADLYGIDVISHAQYESVSSMATAGEQTQALLEILATTSEENLTTVVEKIDRADETVRNSLGSFRSELGRRLGMRAPGVERPVPRSQTGATNTLSTSGPDLANDDLKGHYHRAVGHYPNLRTFSGKQSEAGLRKSHADMIRKLSPVAARIADLLKQAAWLTDMEYENVNAEKTGSSKIGKILDGLKKRDERYHFVVWIGVLLQLVGEGDLDQPVVDAFVTKAGGR